MKEQKQKKALTIKQQLFVDKYIETKGNGTQAALQVYDIASENKENVAHSIATENLQKPAIAREIQRRLGELTCNWDNAIQKALARANQELDDDDPEVRSDARNWLIQLGRVIAPASGVTRDGNNVEHKHIHLQIPKR